MPAALRYLRDRAGLTQRLVGVVDAAEVGRYERGERVPEIRNLARILSAYGVGLVGLSAALSGARVVGRSTTAIPLDDLPGALRRLRVKANLRQFGAGYLSGLGQMQISRWERGHTTPTLESLFTLLATYGSDLEALDAELRERQEVEAC